LEPGYEAQALAEFDSQALRGLEDMRMVSRLFRKQLRSRGLVGSNPMSSAMNTTKPKIVLSGVPTGEETVQFVVEFWKLCDKHGFVRSEVKA
jgi:type II secretory pathway component PulC